MAAALTGLLFHASASAQEDTDDETIEEIAVIGVRQSIQSTIQIKRNSTTIADGLSAVDIGDLPALSIGEALETITGAASHRENGGATEISIRGLGPFLSATHFNGREATNGSGDRAVNFSQFPSELMNKLVIYKTQDASMIEGGVAGLIELGTLKPLEYDRQRFQASLKGNYNPDQQNISDSQNGDLGHRGALSYLDQFDFEGGARFGLSLGYEFSDISQPEAEVRSSSPSGASRFACINEPNVMWEGYYASSTDDCEDQVSDAPYDPNATATSRKTTWRTRRASTRKRGSHTATTWPGRSRPLPAGIVRTTRRMSATRFLLPSSSVPTTVWTSTWTCRSPSACSRNFATISISPTRSERR
jgi:TonB-dependent receptor